MTRDTSGRTSGQVSSELVIMFIEKTLSDQGDNGTVCLGDGSAIEPCINRGRLNTQEVSDVIAVPGCHVHVGFQ